ncbi:hypothetical protein JCM11641_006594 [Rhodosporidiobolus odoratus]
MKPLSLLTIVPLLSLSLDLVTATPPPDLIESLSAAKSAHLHSQTPPAIVKVKRATSSSSSSSSVFTSAPPLSRPSNAKEHAGEGHKGVPFGGLTGGKHTKQSAPVAHGPVGIVGQSSEEEEEGKAEGVVSLRVSHPLTPPPHLHPNSSSSGTSGNAANFSRPSHTTNAYLDKTHSHAQRMRKLKREVDDKEQKESLTEKVEKVEDKVGFKDKNGGKLETVGGKVNGDRNHYWYVDSTPTPSSEEGHGKRALPSSFASSPSSSTSSHPAATRKAASDRPGARAAFEAARATALEVQRQMRSARERQLATVSSSSAAAASGEGKGKAKAKGEKEKEKGKRGVEELIGDVGKDLDAAGSSSSTGAGGFVTSTRPASSTASAAASASSSSSAEGDFLDPSTWGSAISNETNDQYQSLKNKVENLSVLSKIGLASLILVVLLLLSLVTYCCCKLRLGRRRRRAAERVNASLAKANANSNSRASRSGFDDRATAIPMGRFGSASGSIIGGGGKEDKKGKRRGSWRALD